MERVNLETAKMLKEVGYDVDCNAFYMDGTGAAHLNSSSYSRNTTFGLLDHCVDAPTLHECADWLRTVHGLHVHCYPQLYDEVEWVGFYTQIEYCVPVPIRYEKGGGVISFPSHSTALSAAITKALTILKERK